MNYILFDIRFILFILLFNEFIVMIINIIIQQYLNLRYDCHIDIRSCVRSYGRLLGGRLGMRTPTLRFHSVEPIYKYLYWARCECSDTIQIYAMYQGPVYER